MSKAIYTEQVTVKITNAMLKKLNRVKDEKLKGITSNDPDLSPALRLAIDEGYNALFYPPAELKKKAKHLLASQEVKTQYQLQHEVDLAQNESILRLLYETNGKEEISRKLLISKGFLAKRYTDLEKELVKIDHTFLSKIQSTYWIYEYGIRFFDDFKDKITLMKRE